MTLSPAPPRAASLPSLRPPPPPYQSAPIKGAGKGKDEGAVCLGRPVPPSQRPPPSPVAGCQTIRTRVGAWPVEACARQSCQLPCRPNLRPPPPPPCPRQSSSHGSLQARAPRAGIPGLGIAFEIRGWLCARGGLARQPPRSAVGGD
eukprot:227090-Chlamydomonas_euryale.AAC.3